MTDQYFNYFFINTDEKIIKSLKFVKGETLDFIHIISKEDCEGKIPEYIMTTAIKILDITNTNLNNPVGIESTTVSILYNALISIKKSYSDFILRKFHYKDIDIDIEKEDEEFKELIKKINIYL